MMETQICHFVNVCRFVFVGVKRNACRLRKQQTTSDLL